MKARWTMWVALPCALVAWGLLTLVLFRLVMNDAYSLRVANADMLQKYYGPRAFASVNLVWPERYMTSMYKRGFFS